MLERLTYRVDAFGIRAQRARSRRRQAFTLLELLVVAAVIALLLAVLLPSLGWVRERSRVVKCQANLRQLAGAWHQYLEANRNRFPRGLEMTTDFGGTVGTETSPGTLSMGKLLNRYLQLPAKLQQRAPVFECPSDRFPIMPVTPTVFGYYGTSYKANLLLMGPDPLPFSPLDPCGSKVIELDSRLSNLNRSEVWDESRLLLLGDFGWEDAWNIASTRTVEWHRRPSTHNIAFLDGHVAFTLIEKGQYVTSRYSLVPFKTLLPKFSSCQGKGK